MQKYRNRRTGAVIETASVCAGADWEKVAEPARKSAAKTQQGKKDVKTSE